MSTASSAWFVMGGTISLAIAILQFVMYFGGPDVYRFCGTPESLIRFRLARPVTSFAVEILLAAMFTGFGVYAYSAAGVIGPLPWLRFGLAATASIYMVRGLFVIPQISWKRREFNGRDVLYSSIALVVGTAYTLPTFWHWQDLH
jgi:hypothetical protein